MIGLLQGHLAQEVGEPRTHCWVSQGDKVIITSQFGCSDGEMFVVLKIRRCCCITASYCISYLYESNCVAMPNVSVQCK